MEGEGAEGREQGGQRGNVIGYSLLVRCDEGERGDGRHKPCKIDWIVIFLKGLSSLA